MFLNVEGSWRGEGDKNKETAAAKGKTEAKVGGRRAGRRETGTCARIKAAAARSDLELGKLVSEEPDGPQRRRREGGRVSKSHENREDGV